VTAEPRVPQVVLPVGGLGTRLGPLTSHTPKCLLPAGGRPFLSYVIESFARQGAREFLLCSGHLAAAVADAIGDGSALRVEIRHSVEPDPRGVVGALVHARPLLRETFVLSYGDVYHRAPVGWLVQRAAAAGAAAAVMTVVADQAGNADVAAGRVVAYSKTAPPGTYRWLDAGLLLLRASLLGDERTEEELYARLARRDRLAALAVDREHRPYDIGHPAGYHEFVAAVADGLVRSDPSW
jgi:NDP-sugar pyrophosphorylase family protein